MYVWLPYSETSHPRAGELHAKSFEHGLLKFVYANNDDLITSQLRVIELYVDIPILLLNKL